MNWTQNWTTVAGWRNLSAVDQNATGRR